MEKNYKEKIIKSLPELLLVTTYNVLMIAELKSKDVFSLADESQLNAIPNLMERVNKFYEILMTRTDGYPHLLACLKLTNQSRALEILRESWVAPSRSFQESYFGSPNSPQYIQMNESVKRLVEEESVQINRKRFAPSIQDKILSFNVRAPSKLFTGRSQELMTLNKAMTNCGSTTVISQESNITGLGGIGKTELAKHFIDSIDFTVDNPLFDTVVWINAENDTTVGKDFRTLATDKLCISTKNANGGEEEIRTVADKIYRQLESRKTLIVFDNVESAELIDKYRPTKMQTGGDISILITSQQGFWDFGHQIRLSGLKEADAINFVKKGLGMSTEDNAELDSQIAQLVNRLQCFPLAIDQAIAFIKDRKRIRQDYGPQDYLSDLNSKSDHLLAKPFFGSETSYKKTIYEIVTLTLEKIKCDECFGHAATRIVQLMAFVEPDKLPDTIFKQLYDDNFTLDGALGLLERYSIVTFSPSTKEGVLHIFIHRLVQDVVRIILKENEEDNNILQQWLELCQHDNGINGDTVDHFISCWKFASQHPTLVKAHSNVPSSLTNVLIEQSRFQYAHDFATSQLELLKAILTYEDNASALVNLELCVAILQWNHLKEKKTTYFTDLLNKATKYLSESTPVVLNLQLELGSALANQSQFDKALKLLEKIYEQWKLKCDDKESPDSLRVLMSIGEVHRLTKKDDDAAHVFQYIIDESEKNDTKTYSLVTSAKCFLALTEECPVAALEKIKKACEYGEQHLHSKNMELMIAKLNMGFCMTQVGHFSEAITLYHALYKQIVSVHGRQNHYALHVTKNIVECMIELGEHEDLLAKAVEVYDDFKQIFGKSYYFTMSAYNTVGIALYVLGMPEKGLFIIEKCLMSSLFVTRALAPKLLETKLYAALCLEKLGRFKEAFVYLQEIERQNSSTGSSSANNNTYWRLKIHEAYERVRQHCQE